MLLGQTGMLSFGHAVYYGLGAFASAHVLNAVGAGGLHVPVTLLPLVGGLAGLAFGVVFGYVTTRRSGTPFAMISLGIAEMVAASALMFPGFFGGEGGIATNRVVGGALARHHLRSADPGLLPDRRLVLRVHDRDVRVHPDAAGADGQCGARQRRAGEVRGLQSQPRALSGLLSGVLLRRHRRRAGHHQLRDRHRRERRPGGLRQRADHGLHRRRGPLLRTDHRSGAGVLPAVGAVHLHQGLAAVLRAVLHGDDHVRPWRDRQPDHGARTAAASSAACRG